MTPGTPLAISPRVTEELEEVRAGHTVRAASLAVRVASLGTELIDQTTADRAGDCLRDCASITEDIKSDFKEGKKEAHGLHKRICGWENDLLEIPKKADANIRVLLTTWASRTRLAAIADELQRRNELEESTLAQAQALDAAGLTADAEAMIENAPPHEPPAPQAARTSGVSFSQKRTARCLDLQLVPAQFVMFNQKAADAWLASNPFTHIPGCAIEILDTMRRR